MLKQWCGEKRIRSSRHQQVFVSTFERARVGRLGFVEGPTTYRDHLVRVLPSSNVFGVVDNGQLGRCGDQDTDGVGLLNDLTTPPVVNVTPLLLQLNSGPSSATSISNQQSTAAEVLYVRLLTTSNQNSV